jgi:hypothetical protein
LGRSEIFRNGATSYIAIQSLCATLIDLRNHFDGDVDTVLICMVVLADHLAQSALERTSRGVGALSIAEITGISRESVRRKSNRLVEKGIFRRFGSRYHVVDEGSLIDIIGPILSDRFMIAKRMQL